MTNDNNNFGKEIAQAYSAVQVHVLPGLGDAWDAAGPLTMLVTVSLLADAWRASGFQTFDLIQMIASMERALRLAPAK